MEDVRLLEQMLEYQMQQDYEKWQEIIKRQKQQGQSQGSTPNMNILDSILGGGGETAIGGAVDSPVGGGASMEGGSSAGAGVGGVVAAAIALQQYLGKANKREFEGQNSGTVFDALTNGFSEPSSFATEPWLGYAYDKFGWDATEGEKFDAAVKNKDWGKAAERAIPAADYWFGGTPIDTIGYDFLENEVGKGVGKFFLPQRWLARDIAPKLIKKIF